jgi:hypothetical protein
MSLESVPQLSRTTSLVISAASLLVLGALWLGLPQRLLRFMRKRQAARRAAPRPVRHLREREEGMEPILVESLDQADQHIRREHCSCGGIYERVTDTLQLRRTGSDGRTLTVLRVRCTSCGAPQFLSFHVRPN